MKFRRTLSAIYASILILGCSFLLYPEISFFKKEKAEGTLTPDSTEKISYIPTETPVPTEAPLPTVSPVPTKIPMIMQNSLYQPLEKVSELMENYLKAYYNKDIKNLSTLVTNPLLLLEDQIAIEVDGVTNVFDFSFTSKPGINGIFTVVYASFSLEYSNMRQVLPLFREFYIKREADGRYLVVNEPLASETTAVLLESKKTEVVLEKAITSLIQRFNNVCLEGKNELMKTCVSDQAFLDPAYYESRYAYTEYFKDYKLKLTKGINEFDYIAFVTYNEKIVLIDTPAPCLDVYYIHVDKITGEPFIYLGVTSLDTDAYCTEVLQTEEIRNLKAETEEAMINAIKKDDDLRDFYKYLSENRETSEN